MTSLQPSINSTTTQAIGCLLVLFVLVSLPMGYSFWLDQKEQARLTHGPVNPQLSRSEAAEATAAVQASGYITGELPSRSFLVTDPAAFSWLKAARPGDQVLVYNQARMAVLYDPVTHKLITAAPIRP